MTDLDVTARAVQRLANEIKPLLAGKPPEVIGAVLAELLSVLLAGHYQFGEAAIDELLTIHIETVRKLVPVNVKLLKSRLEQ